ncbi:MAG: RNA polymerase sigma factor [Bacteroidota bacterium]|nr:RNA polymerase sigma factor [Bacteroidota bacterium]
MNLSDPWGDQELIEGCRAKDRKAQHALFEKYGKLLYHICLQYTGDRDEAKDVLQDAFIKIFKNIEGFQQKGSFEGWLKRITTHTAIDHFRKEGKMRMVEGVDRLEEEYEEEVEEITMTTDAILNLVKRLPEKARIVFNLFVLENMTHKEIANTLEISEGTSKSQYNRARGLLQKWINEEQTR